MLQKSRSILNQNFAYRHILGAATQKDFASTLGVGFLQADPEVVDSQHRRSDLPPRVGPAVSPGR
jgi:hypothetical protein